MGRLSRDIIWNLGSLAVLSISGVALNIIIGRFYGPETLGVFNQVLALYFILSQFAVGGFIVSTLSLVGKHAEDPEKTGDITSSGLILTAALAGVVCTATFFLADWVGRILESPAVARGLLWVIPGLWCFAVNKILLFSLNALRHMRFYAVCQALRFILILACLVFMTIFKYEGSSLPFVLSAAEIVLLPVLVIYFFRQYSFAVTRRIIPWIREHISFGGRAFFGGILLDTNSKIDVIMLGIFTSDRVVGIYSFAAMLAEGLLQIVVVIQTNMNPILSKFKRENRLEQTKELVRKTVLRLCPAMAAVSIIGIVVFPLLTEMLVGNADFTVGRIYFAVLMAGITIASGHLSFVYLLNQWGYPGWFMTFLILMIATNIVLNALLIPLWSGLGAALATALAFVLTIVYLKTLTWYVTGVRV